MKKLVTALALCAAVSAYAQVESANIVGYSSTVVSNGVYRFVVPMFSNVGDNDKVTLKSIQGNFSDFDFIQFMDDQGNYTDQYTWLTVAGFGVPEDGWYESDLSTLANLTALPRAQAYVVVANSSDVNLVNAGQVQDSQKTVTFNAGYWLTGNFTVTDRMLSDFVFAGNIADFDFVQLLEPNGDYGQQYTWLTVAGFGVPADGWYESDLSTPGDTSVPKSNGFLLQVASGCTMTLPAPSAP